MSEFFDRFDAIEGDPLIPCHGDVELAYSSHLDNLEDHRFYPGAEEPEIIRWMTYRTGVSYLTVGPWFIVICDGIADRVRVYPLTGQPSWVGRIRWDGPVFAWTRSEHRLILMSHSEAQGPTRACWFRGETSGELTLIGRRVGDSIP